MIEKKEHTLQETVAEEINKPVKRTMLAMALLVIVITFVSTCLLVLVALIRAKYLQ